MARGAARKARTREALVTAAQALLAEGRTEASIEEVTRRADVGFGSFYNHFPDKAALWDEALAAALEAHGERVAQAAGGLTDPAEVLCVGLRSTGRLAHQHPRVAALLLHTPLAKVLAGGGLVDRLRHDVEAGVAAGRLRVASVDVAVAVAAGGMVALLGMLAQNPARPLEDLVDDLAARLLIALGVDAAEAERLATLPLPGQTDPLA